MTDLERACCRVAAKRDFGENGRQAFKNGELFFCPLDSWGKIIYVSAYLGKR